MSSRPAQPGKAQLHVYDRAIAVRYDRLADACTLELAERGDGFREGMNCICRGEVVMVLPQLPRNRVEAQTELLDETAIDDVCCLSDDTVIEVWQIRKAVLLHGTAEGFDGNVLAVDDRSVHVPQHSPDRLHGLRSRIALSSRVTWRMAA